jgi:hypothetical protein
MTIDTPQPMSRAVPANSEIKTGKGNRDIPAGADLFINGTSFTEEGETASSAEAARCL